MGIYYTICLSLIKLKYFLIIGFISGIMTFILITYHKYHIHYNSLTNIYINLSIIE
ncbi:AI-2E family transporter [Ehrlichia canis]|nr:AI-2E family transporter [Ehrlichia canis]UKC54817.1 AI-2E family transporter [Ehrlichia canis]UKC55756.1 AI-2E family transporter [Ehrlichia canis]